MLPKRHNAEMFTWLVTLATGTRNPYRGQVRSNTGEIEFTFRGAPRFVKQGCAASVRHRVRPSSSAQQRASTEGRCGPEAQRHTTDHSAESRDGSFAQAISRSSAAAATRSGERVRPVSE